MRLTGCGEIESPVNLMINRAGAGEWAVGGTLLLQAALAAAGCGEHRRAGELADRAAGIAASLRGYVDEHRTCFGPVVVDLVRVLLAAQRGDADEAVRRHVSVVRREGVAAAAGRDRGAYLLDAARAYLLVGDLRGAARTMVDADSVAPAEVRCLHSDGPSVEGRGLVAGLHPAGSG